MLPTRCIDSLAGGSTSQYRKTDALSFCLLCTMCQELHALTGHHIQSFISVLLVRISVWKHITVMYTLLRCDKLSHALQIWLYSALFVHPITYYTFNLMLSKNLFQQVLAALIYLNKVSLTQTSCIQCRFSPWFSSGCSWLY